MHTLTAKPARDVHRPARPTQARPPTTAQRSHHLVMTQVMLLEGSLGASSCATVPAACPQPRPAAAHPCAPSHSRGFQRNTHPLEGVVGSRLLGSGTVLVMLRNIADGCRGSTPSCSVSLGSGSLALLKRRAGNYTQGLLVHRLRLREGEFIPCSPLLGTEQPQKVLLSPAPCPGVSSCWCG